MLRDIAQFGRVPALGAGCRRFNSYYPEHPSKKKNYPLEEELQWLQKYLRPFARLES